ncbi:MAG: hypothetical protein H6742_15305 [Alphaproteobacteria bacterium]|nr:hypothetical protein [Alphaproteobacteria bacterium]
MTRHPSGVVKGRVQSAAAIYASRLRLETHTTPSGVVIFRRGDNFIPSSWDCIVGAPGWRSRAAKGHSHRRSFPPPFVEAAELDSCNSSDALLMNVFCHPAFPLDKERFQSDTGISWAPPRFGVSANLPVDSGSENTQLDMVLGSSASAPIFEAKLTEKDFTRKPARVVERYVDLDKVFRVDDLPRAGGQFCDYQLLRNILAAHHRAADFVLLVDRHRGDLARRLDELAQRVRTDALRCRLRCVTWQQLAGHAPAELQEFLSEKYGIRASR